MEQSYTPDAVNKRLQIEFLKLKKLLASQFESRKPIADQVVNAGYEQKYSEDAVGLRITQGFAELRKLVFSQFESRIVMAVPF